MKAYRFDKGGTIDDLMIIERDIPRPKDGEVLVRMRAASLNFRDILVATSRYPRSQPDSIVPVSDGAGEVVEVGAGVTRVAIGDRVSPCFFQAWLRGAMEPGDGDSALGGSIDGVLAEYCVFAEAGLVRVPDHLSYEEASTLPCAALTAWNGLYGGHPLAAGQTVLVLGTGGVATFAVQFAHAAGARVIVTSSSDDKLAKARALGADEGINYSADTAWEQTVLALTQRRGVDHVIETAGGATTQQSIACTRRGGSVHVIGVMAPGLIDPVSILLGSVTVRGTEVGSREMFEAMGRLISHAAIRPVIDRSFAFDDTRQAYRYLEAAKHQGKVVISIS